MLGGILASFFFLDQCTFQGRVEPGGGLCADSQHDPDLPRTSALANLLGAGVSLGGWF